MYLLWTYGAKYNKVLFFVTDAGLYLIKSADFLTILCLNLINLTYSTHGTYIICECIRN